MVLNGRFARRRYAVLHCENWLLRLAGIRLLGHFKAYGGSRARCIARRRRGVLGRLLSTVSTVTTTDL